MQHVDMRHVLWPRPWWLILSEYMPKCDASKAAGALQCDYDAHVLVLPCLHLRNECIERDSLAVGYQHCNLDMGTNFNQTGLQKRCTMQHNCEQLAFIQQPLVDGKLLGVPGGGKTTTVLSRVLRLINEGLIPRRDGFLVLTFSRAACNDFRARAARMQAESEFTTSNVRTLHSLSGSILHHFRDAAPSMQTVVYRAAQRVHASTEERLRRVPCLRFVRTIILDEAQDVSEVQYDLACALRDKLGASLVLVGDPNQNIYQFQGGTDRYLLNHPGFCVELCRNYRSTAQLVQVIQRARPVVSDCSIVAGNGSSDSSIKPVLVCANMQCIRQDVLRTVRADLEAGLSVAVIGPAKRARLDNLGGGSYGGPSIGLSRVANWLSEEGVPHVLHYREDAESDGGTAPPAEDPEVPAVHLYTVHASKGLEFDSVLLLDFHRQGGSDDALQTRRYVWFVGLSRSKQFMRVYCVAGRYIWQEFERYRDLFDIGAVTGPGSVVMDTYEAQRPVPVLQFAWQRLLRDAVRLPESQFALLEDRWIQAPLTQPSGAAPSGPELPEEYSMGSLYAMWARNAFAACSGAIPPIVQHVADMVDKFVVVPQHMVRSARTLLCALQLDASDLVTWPALQRMRESDDAGLRCLLDYLRDQRDQRQNRHRAADGVVLHVKDDCRWFDPAALRTYVDQARANPDMAGPLFYLCLFKWQYDNEVRYRWGRDYRSHVAALQAHMLDVIAPLAARVRGGWEFGVPCSMTVGERDIVAVVDAVHRERREVMDFKLQRGRISTRDLIQAAGHARMLGEGWQATVLDLSAGPDLDAAMHPVRLRSPTAFEQVVRPVLERAVRRVTVC